MFTCGICLQMRWMSLEDERALSNFLQQAEIMKILTKFISNWTTDEISEGTRLSWHSCQLTLGVIWKYNVFSHKNNLLTASKKKKKKSFDYLSWYEGLAQNKTNIKLMENSKISRSTKAWQKWFNIKTTLIVFYKM